MVSDPYGLLGEGYAARASWGGDRVLVAWYDGPLSGVATYGGRVYWFEVERDWDPDAEVRPLFLCPLTAEELTAERELRELSRMRPRESRSRSGPRPFANETSTCPRNTVVVSPWVGSHTGSDARSLSCSGVFCAGSA
jgi:hypothetical protein